MKYRLDKYLIKYTKKGNIFLVWLLLKLGADINGVFKIPLLEAVYAINFKMVKFLVENGADINANDGVSLCQAVKFDQYDIVEYLIENGANLYVDDEFPLVVSVSKEHYDITKLILSKYKPTKLNLQRCFRDSLKYSYTEIFDILIDNGAIIDNEMLEYSKEYDKTIELNSIKQKLRNKKLSKICTK